jgi:hypothetical protein
MFKNLKNNIEGLERPKDIVTGLLNTDLYDGTLELAYGETSKKGAAGVVLQFKLDNGRYYRQTVWVTKVNGDHFWVKNGVKGYMPGYTIVDALGVVAEGKCIEDLSTEQKTIKVYDYKTRKEQPIEKEVFTSLIGKKYKLAIQKLREDHYMIGSTWAEKNEIVFVYNTDGDTVNEIRAAESGGGFSESWLANNKGKVKDKRTNSKEGKEYEYTNGATATESAEAPAVGVTPSIFEQDA